MPNYVRCKVVIVGSEDSVKPMIEKICGERGIDFEKILPMPAELHEVTSPVRIVSEAEYKKQGNGMMGGFSVGKSITKKMQKEYIKKYGCDNWYDWAINNWGTKWNACDPEAPVFEKEDENTKVTLMFETAWSFPVPIIEKMSKDNPDVEIRVKYSDEDFGYNVGEGVIKNGEWIEENVPDGGTAEAQQIAMELHPDMEEYFVMGEDGLYHYKDEDE